MENNYDEKIKSQSENYCNENNKKDNKEEYSQWYLALGCATVIATTGVLYHFGLFDQAIKSYHRIEDKNSLYYVKSKLTDEEFRLAENRIEKGERLEKILKELEKKREMKKDLEKKKK